MGARERGGVILTSTPELIEVAAGRWRAPDACTPVDLDGAQRIAAEVDRLHEDCVAMLAVAAERGQVVPDELRERLSLGVRGLSATRRLHAELSANGDQGRD
jgi:hypothetical protein